MKHLFSPEGEHAIDQIVARTPLLALDFDGTLAPIVAQPEHARAPLSISTALAQLGELLPVAIVTGRSIADVEDRLGFTPHYIVGNHGAEGLPGAKAGQGAQTIAQWRRTLDADMGARLQTAGVSIEDKGHTISLHYRLARDRAHALSTIETVIQSLHPPPQVIDGKCVKNLLPPGSADKYQAVVALAQIAACDSVIFAGDDVTDDIVFMRAPADWLTVRIEATKHHRARFHLNHQNEVAIFLQRLLRRLQLQGRNTPDMATGKP